MTVSARNWAWDIEEVSDESGTLRPIRSGEKFVLLCVAEHETEVTGYSYPSQSRISERTCLSERSVRSHLAVLQTSRLIIIRSMRRGGSSWANNIYYLNVPFHLRRMDSRWMSTRPTSELGVDLFDRFHALRGRPAA